MFKTHQIQKKHQQFLVIIGDAWWWMILWCQDTQWGDRASGLPRLPGCESDSPWKVRAASCCPHQSWINGHFRYLNWRYIPYMLQYLYFSIQEFPLNDVLLLCPYWKRHLLTDLDLAIRRSWWERIHQFRRCYPSPWWHRGTPYITISNP